MIEPIIECTQGSETFDTLRLTRLVTSVCSSYSPLAYRSSEETPDRGYSACSRTRMISSFPLALATLRAETPVVAFLYIPPVRGCSGTS